MSSANEEPTRFTVYDVERKQLSPNKWRSRITPGLCKDVAHAEPRGAEQLLAVPAAPTPGSPTSLVSESGSDASGSIGSSNSRKNPPRVSAVSEKHSSALARRVSWQDALARARNHGWVWERVPPQGVHRTRAIIHCADVQVLKAVQLAAQQSDVGFDIYSEQPCDEGGWLLTVSVPGFMDGWEFMLRLEAELPLVGMDDLIFTVDQVETQVDDDDSPGPWCPLVVPTAEHVRREDLRITEGKREVKPGQRSWFIFGSRWAEIVLRVTINGHELVFSSRGYGQAEVMKTVRQLAHDQLLDLGFSTAAEQVAVSKFNEDHTMIIDE